MKLNFFLKNAIFPWIFPWIFQRIPWNSKAGTVPIKIEPHSQIQPHPTPPGLFQHDGKTPLK